MTRAELNNGTASAHSEPLVLSEFSHFLPDLKIPATPKIDLQAALNDSSGRVALTLSDYHQKIQIHFSSPNLSAYIARPEQTRLSYHVDGTFTQVDLAHWMGIESIPYQLNGVISLTGTGTDPSTAQLAATGKFTEWIPRQKIEDQLLFDLNLKNGELAGRIAGDVGFGNFTLQPVVKNLLDIPDYRATLKMKDLDLSKLTGISDMQSKINMNLQVTGEGIKPEEIKAKGILTLQNSTFRQIPLDHFHAEASYRNQNIQLGSLTLKTPSLWLSALGNYSFDHHSDLTLTATINNLADFSAWLPDSLTSLKGSVDARLWGEPKALYLESALRLDSLRYGKQTVEKMEMNGKGWIENADTTFTLNLQAHQLQSGTLTIDSLFLSASGSPDSLNADAGIKMKHLQYQINTNILNGDTLKAVINSCTIKSENQHWELDGPPATITTNGTDFDIKNFRLTNRRSELPAFLSAHGSISRDKAQDFRLKLREIDLASLARTALPDHPLSGRFNMDLAITGVIDSLQVQSSFSVIDPGYRQYQLKEISGEIGFQEQQLNLQAIAHAGDSGRVSFISTVPLRLRTDTFRTELLPSEPLRGTVSVQRLPLVLLEEMNINTGLKGTIESEFNLNGTLKQPFLHGKYAIRNAQINEFRFLTVEGSVDFNNNRLSAYGLIIPQDHGKVELNAALPVRYDSLTYLPEVNPEDSVSIRLVAEKITLAILQAMYPTSKIEGMIEADIAISGLAKSPQPTGKVQLQNASVEMREYGIRYHNIGMAFDVSDSLIKLDQLTMRSRDGTLNGSGRVEFPAGMYHRDISQSDIKLQFRKFQPFNHRHFNLQLDGNLSLSGKPGALVYGGDLIIPRGEIFLPTVMRMFGRLPAGELPKPLLIREMEKLSIAPDTTLFSVDRPLPDHEGIGNQISPLRGKARIRIPRNTWIKSDDLYLELSGDVELRKQSDIFELFGSVDVIRGQYDLLGKTFIIDEGSVSFRGGEEMLPFLNITASYNFRNRQRASQELVLQVSGTATAPEVKFQLDGNTVSEGDALSYLLFGKSMNELTIDEQNNIAGAGSAGIAGRAAASLLSAQISNFLNDKLAVDYLEVRSDGSFDNATVTVGKYITNDLFVSYEQRFGETHEKDISRHEVKLEYELFRFLFLQLNNSSQESGFDVIYKFDVK